MGITPRPRPWDTPTPRRGARGDGAGLGISLGQPHWRRPRWHPAGLHHWRDDCLVWLRRGSRARWRAEYAAEARGTTRPSAN